MYCFKLCLRHALPCCFPPPRTPPPTPPTPPPAPVVSIAAVVVVVSVVPRGWPDLQSCATVYVNILILHEKKEKKNITLANKWKYKLKFSWPMGFACFTHIIVILCARGLKRHTEYSPVKCTQYNAIYYYIIRN